MKKKTYLLAALSITIMILLTWQATKILPMGSGYIAKSLCSEYFVAGRKDIDSIWSDIQDIDSVFNWGGYNLDTTSGTVSAWFGPGLVETTAIYRKGLGCTIAAGVPLSDLPPLVNFPAVSLVAGKPPAVNIAPNPDLETILDKAFREPTAESHRQTRAVIVLHKGQIVAERYAPGFDQDTPLIGWSMTKSVTNTLIGMLVGDGVLDLDEPAPVPEWQTAEDPRRAITLRQLLQMSSGLDFQEIYEPGSDATNMLFTVPSAAAYAASVPLAHEPGSFWSYSSGTTNILARIVRDSVGGTAEDVFHFVRTRLYKPLEIDSMVLEPDASGSPVGSSFSYATARDWARMGQFWLQEGLWNGEMLLPKEWIRWSTSPAPAALMGQYGAQFWLNAGVEGEHLALPDLPPSMYFAHGFNSQIVAVFPEQEAVIARLGFTTDDSWDDNAFLAAILAAL